MALNAKMAVWNERLKELMKHERLTQTAFAEAMNARYETTTYTQRLVSQWLHVGMKKGSKGFPEFETVLRIANYFNVSVEYLIGEETKRKELSQYARFFDENSVYWEDDPERNLYFLKKKQEWANDKLRCQKHLFLNEVYDMLGIKRTKVGCIVGWKPESYVDFGLFNITDEQMRKFIAGKESRVLLDFNVDGLIWDII